MEKEERTKPIAAFMAFGTKGDVYPIAAIAAAFACDQKSYDVFLVTHSAHKSLSFHLAEKRIECCTVSSPPVLSIHQSDDTTGTSFSMKERIFRREHRQECLSVLERILGVGPSIEGDFILINFFALEGWSLAEVYHVPCIVAAPYVVPYSAPASFERYFQKDLPLLYKYLIEAPIDKVSWNDVIHWMWPLFTENWGSWRYDDLHLSSCLFTDPITGLPTWHERLSSPLLLYGFSKEVVECPGYWPSNVQICGFWFLPMEWQFSCNKCKETFAVVSSRTRYNDDELCPTHFELQSFLKSAPIFIGLSSVGSMGFLKNPKAFISVLQNVLDNSSYRFILFTAGYEPLEALIKVIAVDPSLQSNHGHIKEDSISLFNGKLFCFSGSIPYNWLFPKCSAAIHHGGSGTTAAALHAGIPQVVCPFVLDQFYWAEKMHWLGVAPEPLKRNHLIPDIDDDGTVLEAAAALSLAIQHAWSPDVKACAREIAEKISLEDGTSEAVRNIKKELGLS